MLSDVEKREIIDCLENNLPLPEKYRFRLFAETGDLELFWPGKSGCQELRGDTSFRPLECFGPDNQGWKNRLFLGDNADVLKLLAKGPFRDEIDKLGGIRLIYIDPPFNANTAFSMDVEIGGSAGSQIIRQLAYRDIWGKGMAGFLNMIYGRLILMRDLLADDGSIYAHCDWRTVGCMRLLLDEIFGHHVNEIIWHYTGGGRSAKHFSRKHDTILVYSKSGRFIFNRDDLRVPYKKTSGYARSGIVAKSGKKYMPNPLGTIPDDVWDIPIINPMSRERCAYPTQKPEALLERIILASSGPGDLVADFFCGSGTLPAVAERLGRKWLAVDRGKPAIHCARKRVLQARKKLAQAGKACQAFEILAESAPDYSDAGQTGLISLEPHWRGNRLALEITAFTSPAKAAAQNRHPSHDTTAWLDYWAIDYGLETGEAQSGGKRMPETFASGWQTWRENGAIALVSPWREMPRGARKIRVLAIDVFGNETRTGLEVSAPDNAG